MRRFAASAILLCACSAAKPPAPFERALRRGEREERDGRAPEAADAYARAIEACRRPADCALARFRRARMLERAGATAQAAAEYLRAADADPDGAYRGQAWWYAARLADASGRAADAQGLLDRIVLERAFEGISERALRARLEQVPPGERLEWLGSIERRLRATDLGDDVLWLEAGIRADAHDAAGEIATLERLVRRHPYPRAELWDDALWRLADLAEAAGDPATAIARLRPLSAAYESSHLVGSYALPKMDDAALRIARLELESRRDPAAAEAAADDLLDRFEDSELRDDALFLAARARLARGDREGACDRIAALRDDYPESKWLKPERMERAGLRCRS